MIAGCCAFHRDRWMASGADPASIGAVRGRRRLAAIEALLRTHHGFAMLVYADIPLGLLRPGEIDGTDDIPRMSRRDNLWSQVVLSAVAATIAFLDDPRASIGPVDLYFDRKDLTAAHRAGFERVLRDTIPEIQQQARAEFPARASASLAFALSA